jgi:L-asparaginase
MNTEAVVAKLMWVLDQTRDPQIITQMIQTQASHDIGFV